MSHRDILLRMRGWIEAEMEKAKLPGGEPFIYTSLAYCAAKAEAGAAQQEVLAILRKVVEANPPYMQFDAMRPHRAIFVINTAIATA